MIIKSFKIFENQQRDIILYHGTHDEHDFTGSSFIYDGTFFSTNKSEASTYGNLIYEVTLKPNLNLLDTNKLEDCEKLINQFGELYDTYFEPNEDGYIINKPEKLYYHSDSWNPIENTDGVLDWLELYYDGVWIYEGGVRNLFLFEPVNEKIKSYIKIIPEDD